MMRRGRHLGPDEQALWQRVIATVRPLGKRPQRADIPAAVPPLPVPRPAEVRDPAAPAPSRPGKANPAAPGVTLDGGWDRRLRRGDVAPERTIDLHGHTLASAHAALEAELADAVADDVRTLLVVTGRPPRGNGVARRGLIRASIGDWLAGSRHASRIAAVRNAHPRHGGAGALYVILRRRR